MELNVQEPASSTSPEPSTEPSPSSPDFNKPGSFNPDVDVHKGNVRMLKGFRDGVREGTYKGAHLNDIAMGLQLLDGLIGQAEGQLQYSIRLRKQADDEARAAIKKIREEANAKPA